jgi:hypothetical protein
VDLTKWLQAQWDRVTAWACVAAGVVVLIIGWVGVSGTEYPAAQLPYIISGGVGGIFLLGLGAMLWLSADLRDEWRKLDRIDENLARGAAAGLAMVDSREAAVANRAPAVYAHTDPAGDMDQRSYGARSDFEPSADVAGEAAVRSRATDASRRSTSVKSAVDSRAGTAVRRRRGPSSDDQADQ